ncbi:hypothetical protein [Paractinoplanes deccanensis]|uniref:hypothetical protein n=1 Tax=Paractinoplanes deccanensis TaxID=113561 RepID=UPI001944181A|nr:hypothetical protein [Actinoplanes deccanensis]
MILLAAGLTIAMPLVAVNFGELAWWVRLAVPLIAIPVLWWYVLCRLVFRVDLTDRELRLRAVVGAWEVPLGELDSFGAWGGEGLVKLERRDGRSWMVLAGSGLVDFADQLGRAAPHARVEVNAVERTSERAAQFFENGR